jgi:hypothetical protein
MPGSAGFLFANVLPLLAGSCQSKPIGERLLWRFPNLPLKRTTLYCGCISVMLSKHFGPLGRMKYGGK